MNIAYIGNQGGEQVYGFYAGMAETIAHEFNDANQFFSVWLKAEKDALVKRGLNPNTIFLFEEWVAQNLKYEPEVERIMKEYREVNWSAVIAAERAFTDYSQLLGSAGERRESEAYILRLLVNIVTYLENLFKKNNINAIVCQTSDTLFSLAAHKVAAHFGIRVFAISPAWLLEPGCQGAFFANNEHLESTRMIENYNHSAQSKLTPKQQERADVLKKSITEFKDKSAFASKMKGANAGMQAVSPNFKRLFKYLAENNAKNKNVEYSKISPLMKVRGNLLRVFRKYFARPWLGKTTTDVIPENSIFFAIHYQPEQSTLAQGLYYVNQVALIENISKSLPLGYTLVVKEHPWGRGSRPVWQYKHISRLYNVVFCDAPSKEIVLKVKAVVAVTGTIALESMVLDRPTIVLGHSFFNYSDLVYQLKDIQELPEVLKKILVDNDYENRSDRKQLLQRFLISYLEALIPYFPTMENASHFGRALAVDLDLPLKQSN